MRFTWFVRQCVQAVALGIFAYQMIGAGRVVNQDFGFKPDPGLLPQLGGR